ncbi:MAG: hypothetical protein WB792_07545 [Desulfobacterales bacterium]
MVKSSEVFEKNYQNYCAQIAKIDFEPIKDKLDIIHEGDRMFIPFLNNRYLVSNNGIFDESGKHRGLDS